MWTATDGWPEHYESINKLLNIRKTGPEEFKEVNIRAEAVLSGWNLI